ncbi:bacterio-opsin activator domain-containing protein [Saliphagus infecundisoli]|uniref:Bacterio-opsin activator domain-containing protein n=1 Tax=Saliphagus infecundisoli TaxID=1849069 RepID=A0ABD5QD60_9EURY|nr:bacterio-opsin activator domain-containing protein [Saliphagus infecundisoli]
MGVDADERDRRKAVAGIAMGALEGDGRRLAVDAVAAVGDVLAAPAALFERGPDGPERLAGEFDDSSLAERALTGEGRVVASEAGVGAVVGPAGDPRGVLCVGSRELSEADIGFLEDVVTVLERAWAGGKFRQFAERLEEVVWMSSVEIDEIHYVNPAYEEVWGRSRESLYEEPMSFLEGIHSEDRDRIRETIPQRARDEYEEVYRVVRPDDSIRWVRDRAYPIREGGEVRRVVGIAEDVTERRERRRRLERANRLNRLCQEITHLVITTPDRQTLEQRVCDRLAEPYRFVWIGGLAPGGTRVISRVWAGVEEGYLDAVRITADEAETAAGPTGRAVETQEVQVVTDITTDPDFEPWREAAVARGYRASIAVPIAHDGLLYGLLNVYAACPDAFSGDETRVLSRLGEVIGHAIAAIERKAALAGDTVVELEFRAEGFPEALVACSRESGGILRFEHLSRHDDRLIAYGTATGVPEERLCGAVEREEDLVSVRVIEREEGSYGFELEADGAVPLVETLAGYGGRLSSATIADGDCRFVVELPEGADTRRLIDALESGYETSYVAKRTTSREAPAFPGTALLDRRLTERQREVLETATYAGYFEWPRATTGEEVAERLRIAPATFAQHLRAAERKLFEATFDRE